MEISEIFESLIKIESKVISIDTLFNNQERVANTNYKPAYQRNYVWDDEKATYFIESILLGTEIPPLIYFRNSNKVEIIDGRQRYETVLRFIGDKFKLKKNGLQQLENIGIANKSFKGLGNKLIEVFEDTKLRIIEFSFHAKNAVNPENEDIVKREIFKRYNSGITPLKSLEIDKAVYLFDDLNAYLKSRLKGNPVLLRNVSSVLHFEKMSDEILLKKVRQLLVQHYIPIKYYAIKKDTIISKYYEHLFSNITEEELATQLNGFIEKINLLLLIKDALEKRGYVYNRLISECLFWAFSVLEVELSTVQEENLERERILKLIGPTIIEELVDYIGTHISAFTTERSSFYANLFNRYDVIAKYFAAKFNIDFEIYLNTSSDFLFKNKELASNRDNILEFEDLRINKADSQSIAIVDICRQMERQRFLIRPAYQRNEVIDKKKSSSIIESILLGIKLPPIFIFKREDQVSEVLDGQQRLLSILGFMGKSYLDENNAVKKSNKDKYSLNLKKGILTGLNGKTFEELTLEQQEKIQNFDLWIIEINQKRNPRFDPIDLFIRLNNKPYPIKEDTFEMWNSYISRDIVETIKMVHHNNKEWFYYRKNNSRMEDENIITSLIYFEFGLDSKGRDPNYVSKDLDAYKTGNKVNFRVRSKNEISRVLEEKNSKTAFIKAANDFEFIFIKKLKRLLSDSQDESAATLNHNLNEIFAFDNGKRTQQSFYALWYLIYDIPYDAVVLEKLAIRAELKNLFKLMTSVPSKVDFENSVREFKSKYSTTTRDSTGNAVRGTTILDLIEAGTYAQLGDIAICVAGNPHLGSGSSSGKTQFSFVKKAIFENYRLVDKESIIVNLDEDEQLANSQPKILFKRYNTRHDRLDIAYTEKRVIFSAEVLSVLSIRKGFAPKFILAVSASKLVYYYFQLFSSRMSGVANVSSSFLKQIPIPKSSIRQQGIIKIVVDCLLSFSDINEQYLYFERLLDALIYELFLGEILHSAGVEFFRYLYDIAPIDPEIGEQTIVDTTYRELSHPSSEISASLLKLLTIEEISLIEGNGED